MEKLIKEALKLSSFLTEIDELEEMSEKKTKTEMINFIYDSANYNW